MQWDMDVDICSMMVLLLISVLQLSKRYITIKRSRIFLTMVILQTIALFTKSLTKYLLLQFGY